MGNKCCINMKYRNENDEQREIILIERKEIEKEIQLDLNDSNPFQSKLPSNSCINSQILSSARGNKKKEFSNASRTTTDPKSNHAYPLITQAHINQEQTKEQIQFLYQINDPSFMIGENISESAEGNAAYIQINHPHYASEKMVQIEKKLQLLENYINEKQIAEQAQQNKQPSIAERLQNENKEIDEKSASQDQALTSNFKAIEQQYFEKFQFEGLLRIVDQMQQTSFKEASTVSISTSFHHMTSVNLDKIHKVDDSGDIYFGASNEKNQKEGFGILFGANGIYYEGEWLADKFEGRGIYIESDQYIVKGNFKNGVSNGNCIIVKLIRKLGKKDFTKDQDDYDEISRKASLQTTYSEYSGFIQSKYKGEVVDGKKHGNGELVVDKNFRYVGGFAYDKFNGYGICVWQQGGIYEGQWVNDKKEGKGQELWPGGKSYCGEYQNDVFHGYGQYINEEGDIYEGYWNQGEMDGQGILTKQDQTSIYGVWQKGVLQSNIPL